MSRNRRPEPDCCTYDELNRHLDAQVIVNSTPIGMYPNNGHSPLDGCSVKWTDFQQLETALDAIYNPYRTKFLMDAEEAGAEVESGLAMLVYQGLRSAQIWGEVPRSGKGRRIVVEQTRGENGRKKEKKKRESEEMRRDYPQIINRFSLYIGAGMSVRNAWQRITEDYRKNKERTGRRKAYEEMIYTENQMKNKAAESECYEEYGIRCGLSVYRRFGTLLSQNLRKGSKGLSELLKRETGEMFEERKKQARKLGEEAGTKLMIPLFMMLAVVFIIVIVPAFFTIQI